jgi:hypothetical protein
MSTTTEKLYRGYAFVFSLLNDKGTRNKVQQEKRKETSREDVQNGLLAVQRLFADLKIKSVFRTEDELTFSFWRCCHNETTAPCGDDEAKWKSETKPLAA